MQMPLRGSNSDSICEIEELMFKFVIIRAGILFQQGGMHRCGACMTRTPPKNRRRLTGGALWPQEGILRHAPMLGRTPLLK